MCFMSTKTNKGVSYGPLLPDHIDWDMPKTRATVTAAENAAREQDEVYKDYFGLRKVVAVSPDQEALIAAIVKEMDGLMESIKRNHATMMKDVWMIEPPVAKYAGRECPCGLMAGCTYHH